MIKKNKEEISSISMKEIIDFKGFAFIILAIMIGAIAAAVLMPQVIPSLKASITGQDPKVFWFLSRGSAIASYCLLWLSMFLGLLLTNKMARSWMGNAGAYDLHQFISLAGIGFVLFHALILLGDKYIGFNLINTFLPFSNASYRPFWTGLGQIGLYLWLILIISFYMRKKIGNKSWRAIHFMSFVLYMIGLLHGIYSGTDTSTFWAAGLYWSSGAILLFLMIYRILASITTGLKPLLQPNS